MAWLLTASHIMTPQCNRIQAFSVSLIFIWNRMRELPQWDLHALLCDLAGSSLRVWGVLDWTGMPCGLFSWKKTEKHRTITQCAATIAGCICECTRRACYCDCGCGGGCDCDCDCELIPHMRGVTHEKRSDAAHSALMLQSLPTLYCDQKHACVLRESLRCTHHQACIHARTHLQNYYSHSNHTNWWLFIPKNNLARSPTCRELLFALLSCERWQGNKPSSRAKQKNK